MNVIPEHLRYTSDHEWVADGPGGATYRVGITDFAQHALGDVVFVQLPDQGTVVRVGQSLGEVESTKSVSEIYAPLDGVIVEVNSDLADQPELVNSDPFGAGWLVEIEAAADVSAGHLLDAAQYRAQTQG